MNDDEQWKAIYNLSNISDDCTWGYRESASGKKFLAKKFKIFGGEVHDFTIYRLENMIDHLWEDDYDNTDIWLLSNILEAYMNEEVLIDWVEGFPMAYPFPEDFEDFDFDPFV